MRMFILHPIPELIDYCESLCMDIDFGKNVKGKGAYCQQLTGIICENTVKDALNIPLVKPDDKPDDGWDFTWNTRRIDIKGMTRTTEPKEYFACNFIARQLNRTTDYLLFTSYNKTNNNVTVCGLISKADFLNTASYFPSGTLRKKDNGTVFSMTQPFYEIPISKLVQLYSLDDLNNEVK